MAGEAMKLSPGDLRSRLEELQAEVRGIENDLDGPVRQGVVALIGIRHELVEASEALERAISELDENYKDLQ